MKFAIAFVVMFFFGHGTRLFLEPVIRDTFQGARHSRAWGTYGLLLLLAIGLTPFIGAFAVFERLVKRVKHHA